MRTLIKGGFVVDPASRVAGQLNLLLAGGRVAAVTRDHPAAERVIDAAGKVVTPGFIDIHMHEDPVGPDGKIAHSIYHNMLRMGVTTAAGGCRRRWQGDAWASLTDCGMSPAQAGRSFGAQPPAAPARAN